MVNSNYFMSYYKRILKGLLSPLLQSRFYTSLNLVTFIGRPHDIFTHKMLATAVLNIAHHAFQTDIRLKID